MAERIVEPTPLEEVIRCIEDKQSFLLEAGAGSGKTWTLIEVLKHILITETNELAQGNKRVVCITYTNVAKNEILSRINHDQMVLVATIHEFLWEAICPYQTELREAVLAYNDTKVKEPVPDLAKTIRGKPIIYSQRGRNFEHGRISHDEIIELSSALFDKYPKICRLAASKYPYVFVDEYQDTDPRTVALLVDRLLPKANGSMVIGFFGDSMQKIYNQGIGTLNHNNIRLITKHENFRCSKSVIGLLNKMRPKLVQQPGGGNVDGRVSFFVSSNEPTEAYSSVLRHLYSNEGWAGGTTKVLMLTHKGIAEHLDYAGLLAAFDKLPFGRDQLMKGENEFASGLSKVEMLVGHYAQKRYGEFLKLLARDGFIVTRHAQKRELQDLMTALDAIRTNGTIREVLEFVFAKGLLARAQSVKDFESRIAGAELSERDIRDKAFYDALMAVNYREAASFYIFLEEQTPFSTQHGVKGAEYQDVLVILDDKAWNQYNFNDVFAGNKKNQARYDRTLNLLYVCCSRAKDKLAILVLSELSAKAMETVHEWFSGNVVNVATLN